MEKIIEQILKLVCRYELSYKSEPNMIILPKEIYNVMKSLAPIPYSKTKKTEPEYIMGLKICVVEQGEMEVYEEVKNDEK